MRKTAALTFLPTAAGAVALGGMSARAPILGGGAALLTGLALVPWRWLFLSLALAASASGVQLNLAGENVRLGHLFILPLLASVVIRTWGSRQRWSVADWAVTAFIGVHILSSLLMAEDLVDSLTSAILLVLGALAYFATRMGISSQSRLVFAGRSVLLAAAAGAAIALLASLGNEIFGTKVGVSAVDPLFGSSATGLVREHNHLGSLSGAAAMSFLVLSRRPNPLFSRRLSIAGFLVCFAAMLASLTRGSWLGFGLSLVAFLLLAPMATGGRGSVDRFAVRFFTVIVVTGTLLLLPLASDAPPPGPGASLPERVAYQAAHVVDTQSRTAENRVNIWSIALDEAQTSPLIGLGSDSYGQRHHGLKKTWKKGQISNLYLRTFYDTGVLGSVFLLAFFGTLLWPGRELRRSWEGPGHVTLAFIFGGIVLTVAYAFSDALLSPWPWITFGVIGAGRRLTGNGKATSPGG